MRILLIVYDNGSHVSTFPVGLAYIASVLLSSGHQVEIYGQDVHHYSPEHLREHLMNNHFDVVGLGVVGGYYQYRKLLEISAVVNQSRGSFRFILGGHGPSPEPEYFLNKTNADIIVIGEGEKTILDVVNAIDNKSSLLNVNGIAFRDGQETHINWKRELIKNLDEIPFPAYELFPINYYRLIREPHSVPMDFVMPVLSGRGCNFSCNFCFRMDKGLRLRSNRAIIEEIKFLNKTYGINYISFYDELLMCSEERTIRLSEDIIRSKVNIKWNCNGRLNYATQNVLNIMKKSGCVFINYGIESLDNGVLDKMNKCLTEKQIIRGVEETISCGISPGLNIIWGNLGDTGATLEKSVNFLLKYDDGSQLRTIRPVTPYPGSPLYDYSIKHGLLKDVGDFYENKHINSDLLTINFTDLIDDEYYSVLMKIGRAHV